MTAKKWLDSIEKQKRRIDLKYAVTNRQVTSQRQKIIIDSYSQARKSTE